ncbi:MULTISPECIES: hypothetical protein [unclassified Shewanella]|uniref:hypothetical protein n=1 Tax=unclassified Shewanella TaxID=196818 RepID=UPI0035535967
MWHALFVGLPLFSAVIIGLVTVPLGYKGIIHKQFPPKGVKVYKPTSILRGWKASGKSILHLLTPSLFILFSVWGYFQVEQMPHEIPDDFDLSVCETNK